MFNSEKEASSYTQEALNDRALTDSLVLIEREVTRRKEKKKDAERAQAEAELQNWKLLQQELREAQHYFNKAEAEFQGCKISLETTQCAIQRMLDNGFEPPVPVAPKPPVTPSRTGPSPQPTPTQSEPEVSIKEPEWVDCPSGCGMQVREGQAYHRLAEGLVCICDEKRALASGLSRIVIEEALERQAQVKANAEQQ